MFASESEFEGGVDRRNQRVSIALFAGGRSANDAIHATPECLIPSPVICWRRNSKMIKFRWFWGASGGLGRILRTRLRENCRAPLAGMASCQSDGKAEALGTSPPLFLLPAR